MQEPTTTHLVQAAYLLLEKVQGDPDWQRITNDEASHPDLSTDLADALHYTAELLQKLGGQHHE